MKINFVTPTRLSYIDLITMGGSEKLGDENKIGQFCSGLKYALALFLRNDVKFTAFTVGETYIGGMDREVREIFTPYTYFCEDDSTGKTKDVIGISVSRDYESFNSLHCEDIFEAVLDEKYETGFSTELGYNWELYMAMREIYSNMLDEGGYYTEDDVFIKKGTIITLEFNDDSKFAEIWKNRHLYINESDPLYVLSDEIEVLKNEENYLRIYKQNILVYEDRERPSRFAWNIKFGEIDERRVLSNVFSVESKIANCIIECENIDFLKTIISENFKTDNSEFLNSISSVYNSVSDVIHDYCSEIYSEFGEVRSYSWLIDKVKKRKDCKIGGKKIVSVEDSLWAYSSTVVVESKPIPIVENKEYNSFQSKIDVHWNFNLNNVDVRTAKLKGKKVIADKFEKCLIIDESFDIKEDFHSFIIEYLDLTSEKKGNIIEALGKYVCTLISK